MNTKEEGLTVVASKSSVPNIATGMAPLLDGLIEFGKLPGLMSISTLPKNPALAGPMLQLSGLRSKQVLP